MSRPDLKPGRTAASGNGAPDNAAIRDMVREAAEGTRFARPAPGDTGAPAGAGQGRAPPPEPAKKATFDLPLSLHRALQLAAVEKGVTMRHIVLQSLHAAGYPVPATELVADRRTNR